MEYNYFCIGYGLCDPMGIDVLIQFTKDKPSMIITSIYIFCCALWSFKGGMDVLNLWEN